MEVYGLTNPEQDEINPLRYHLTLGKRGLELHFTELGASELLKILRNWNARKILPKNFILPDEKNWGIDGVLETVGSSLQSVGSQKEFFVVRIPSNDKSKLAAIGETLSFIFHFEHYLTVETAKKKDVNDDSREQLFSLETMFSKEEDYHGGALEFSVSPKAAAFLAKHPPGTQIPKAIKEMKNQWLIISGTKRKESRFADMAFTAHLREHGMLSLSTMGSCACLGGIPEELRENEGFSITSHNVDYTPQQINLLIGLACLWDWVRESLTKETA